MKRRRDCETYDPSSNTWKVIASMTTPRENPAAAVLGDCMYAISGGNGDRAYLFSVEKYCVGNARWTSVASLKHGNDGIKAAGWLGNCAHII